ncbi:MAG: RHS repeat protein, partial [Oscillospiraceae bacterium]|nr:RHS repeat protein [Oscillospiraceae bacterium]
YVYDEQGRLISETYVAGDSMSTSEYVYDEQDRRVSETYTNELGRVTSTQYEYDEYGYVIREVF